MRILIFLSSILLFGLLNVFLVIAHYGGHDGCWENGCPPGHGPGDGPDGIPNTGDECPYTDPACAPRPVDGCDVRESQTLSPGSYSVIIEDFCSDEVTLDCNNAHLSQIKINERQDITIKRCHTYSIYVTNSSYVTLANNFGIDDGYEYEGDVKLNQSNFNQIRGNNVTSIDLFSSSYNTIEDNDIIVEHTSDSEFWIENSHHNTIRGTKIHGKDGETFTSRFFCSHWNTVEGSIASGSLSSNSDFHFYNSDYNTFRDNNLPQFRIQKYLFYNDLCPGPNEGNTITRNKLYTVGEMDSESSNYEITDNDLSLLGISGSNHNIRNNRLRLGINVIDGTNNVVDSNIITFERDGSGEGIHLASVTASKISNNVIQGSADRYYGQDGIGLWQDEGVGNQNNEISNNLINETDDGIVLDGGIIGPANTNNIISDNIIVNSDVGIRFFEWNNDNFLTRNRICFNTVEDIRIEGVQGTNTGQDNICNEPEDWNDNGVQGCTATCNPVLLVHGIYSDDSMWNDLVPEMETLGFDVYRVGEEIGQKGLVPNNGHIWILQNQLADAIDNVLAKTDADQVDIIAHSMGGLVTRDYIKRYAFTNVDKVRKLIMLGTPNEGAPIADHENKPIVAFFGRIAGDDPFVDAAREEMIPGSPYLETLNANYPQRGTVHHAIAGNLLPTDKLLALMLCTMQPNYCGRARIITDSIVPVSSVNFVGDCYETPATHTDTLGPSYYDDQQNSGEALNLLRASRTNLLPCSVRATSENSVKTQVISLDGIIEPGEEQIVYTDTSFGSSFSGVLNWTSGVITQEFVSPSGVVINAENYQEYPGTSYEIGEYNGTWVEWFTFDTPEEGLWTVKIIARALSDPEQYMQTMIMDKEVSLTLFSSNTTIYPNQTVLFSAKLVKQAEPVTDANVTAIITKPNGSVVMLKLFDDGNHNDGARDDGRYANVFSDTREGGYHEVRIEGRGNDDTGDYFELFNYIPLFVLMLPDLEISEEDIELSELIPSPNTQVTITASVANRGNDIAENATILFFEGDPSQAGRFIGAKQATFSPGDVIQLSVNWTTPSEDEAEIYVLPGPNNPFLDADYSNEQARKVVRICGYCKAKAYHR